MSQDLIEKNYYEQVNIGHYIDAKYSENQWKMAKVIDKDKRYAVISFQALNSKEEQVYLNGHKVAPLRFYTEGYTGSIYKPHRPQPPPLPEYKNHLEILQQTYLKDSLPTAFTITQYLRGEFFVMVHSLLTRDDLNQGEGNEAMKFLLGLIDFVVKLAKKIRKTAPEYFQAAGSNKMLYLLNEKVAIVNSLNELLILLNLIIKAESNKHVVLFKNRYVNQDTLIKFFMELKEEKTFSELFQLNDSNGRWLSFNIHKHLYFLLKRYYPKWALPDYKLRDYQEVFGLYPFLIKEEDKANTVQQSYVGFIISCLKEPCSFQTKLKAIQELRKITDNQLKLFRVDEKYIYSALGQQGVIEHMMNEYHFNPEIFKRFTPILQNYCKIKSLSMKNINNLFKLTRNRHESQVAVIYEIICMLAEFVQVDALDQMYSQILKYPLNNEKTLELIKEFTINAIVNHSKQKSFFNFFKKTKNSGKYGYYGLDLLFKELQDDGAILKQNLPLVFETIQQIFSVEIFQGERTNYLITCIGWLEKIRNYGQSIKLIDTILSTFPSSAYFAESRKDLLEKLISKHSLLQLAVFGLKHKAKINQSKVSLPDIIKYLYQFLENYYDYFIPYIKLEHIEFLWTLGETKQLAVFLRKSKSNDSKKKEFKDKYIKKLDEQVQEDVLTKLIRKPQFYQRVLSLEEFEALDELFISYNLLKKKLDISEIGIIRYLTPEMEGYYFYFEFLQKMADSPHADKIIRRIISIFLRPKDEKEVDLKANTWKMCLLKIVERLKGQPEVCLRAINYFFDMIEGKLIKPNLTFQGSIDVIVTLDTQEKTISLPKNCTIFKLRKQVMNDFNLSGDFTLHSPSMRRDITFAEEEEYSLNALTNSQTGEKSVLITITNRKKEKHVHMQALELFKELIEKEEMFYSLLFSLNNEKNHEAFWKTVELMPVNRQLIKKIENCPHFTQKEWKQLLKNETVESLQYHLNIIHEIMEKNNKWGALFAGSGGLATIIDLLSHKLKDEEVVIQRIVNRCILIIVHVLDTVNEIEDQLLQQLKLTLIAKLIYLFKSQVALVTIGIDSLNNIFHLLRELSKIYKKQTIQIDLQIMLKILEYGVFKPKNKTTLEFIEQDFEHYLINHYHSPAEKIKIYQYLLGFLKIDIMAKKEHSELFFLFLIDFMNTFVEQENQIVHDQKYLDVIKKFVMDTLQSQQSDHSKQQHNQMLQGALKLLIYTLNYANHSYDQTTIFKILINDYLLSKGVKTVKHELTLKSLYECIKKILFTDQTLIQFLIEEVAPQLRANEWRKNNYTNWQLEAKRQERSLYCGLENLGATCYINCLIQQLFMISHFRQNFLAIDSSNYKPSPEQNEILQFQSILAGLKFSNKRSINTRKFCESFITYQGVPINPMVQSDADQFLNQLMEKIEAFLKFNNRHDIIENTFEGTLSNQLNCEGCPHKSEKEDHFFSIGVNIRGKKTLEEALQGFVDGEILDGDNAYFCQLCQKKVRTQKRLCIKALPNILTIVIKRFQFNYDQMRKIKINSYLKFPTHINMKKYTAEALGGAEDLPDQPYEYSLRGTVIHSGTSEGGHYYSFINSNDKWFCFNDEFIEEIKMSRIEEDGFGGEDKSLEGEFKFEKYKNAYILFYEKDAPSASYHAIEEEVNSQFSSAMQKQIVVENNNADFLSVILDSNFIRLSQNFSALELQEAYEFSFLYFHTVVLRDRNKDEHIPNYYRILDSLLSREQVSVWYLSQINHRFVKQFLVEGPRTTRFVCTSLILKALTVVPTVPKNFIGHAIFCLKKAGMTPFAKIFLKLSQAVSTKQTLIEYEYPQRVMGLLMDRSNENFKMLQVQSFESYFGADCSQKDKEREFCPSSLCESLANFDIPLAQAVQIFQKHSSRAGSKTFARLIANKVDEEQLSALLITLETTVTKQGEFKKQDLEKYLFLIRYTILSEPILEWKIEKSIYSLKKIIYECRTYYDPMEMLLKEINYIAARSIHFMKKWKSHILDKENLYDMAKTIKYWLKEADHPQYLYKSDDFKRKIASVTYDEKYQIEAANKAVLEKRVNWMVEREINHPDLYESDIEGSPVNSEVIIRNKKVRIKQHLGLIKKVQVEGAERWSILQKSELDIYHSL